MFTNVLFLFSSKYTNNRLDEKHFCLIAEHFGLMKYTLKNKISQLAETVKYTDCISLRDFMTALFQARISLI